MHWIERCKCTADSRKGWQQERRFVRAGTEAVDYIFYQITGWAEKWRSVGRYRRLQVVVRCSRVRI